MFDEFHTAAMVNCNYFSFSEPPVLYDLWHQVCVRVRPVVSQMSHQTPRQRPVSGVCEDVLQPTEHEAPPGRAQSSQTVLVRAVHGQVLLQDCHDAASQVSAQEHGGHDHDLGLGRLSCCELRSEQTVIATQFYRVL